MDNTINKNNLIKHINGELTDPEIIGLINDWISSNNQNKKYYQNLKVLWLSSGMLASETEQIKERVWERIENKALKTKQKPKTIQQHFKWKRYYSVAASIIVLISITLLYWLYTKPEAVMFYTFTADKGSKSRITLTDGTVVHLNSETELKVPHDFDSNNRNVELSGEAYFQVVKTGKENRFTVHTNELNIKVLGTSFNVKSYPEEGTIETTLEEGKVIIEKKTDTGSKNLVSLKPNQRAIFIKKEGEILLSELKSSNDDIKGNIQINDNNPVRKEEMILKERIETNLYTAWTHGEFKFQSERFDHLIVKMERWYGVNIKLENDSLQRIRFTGTLKNETVEQALEALKISQPFNYHMDIENNMIYIK